MKKRPIFFLVLSLLALIVLLPSVKEARAELSEQEELKIRGLISIIEEAISREDPEAIIDLLAPDASSEVKAEIRDGLQGVDLDFRQRIKSIEELSDGKVKVKGSFSLEAESGGSSWSLSGLGNFYVFQQQSEGEWRLLESNFQDKLAMDYAFGLLGKIFAILFPVMTLLFIFWVWMLVDVAQRPMEEKRRVIWIVLMVFFGFFASIAYYFFPRRRLVKSSKQ